MRAQGVEIDCGHAIEWIGCIQISWGATLKSNQQSKVKDWYGYSWVKASQHPTRHPNAKKRWILKVTGEQSQGRYLKRQSKESPDWIQVEDRFAEKGNCQESTGEEGKSVLVNVDFSLVEYGFYCCKMIKMHFFSFAALNIIFFMISNSLVSITLFKLVIIKIISLKLNSISAS
jgi:hypothetical protein